MHFLPLPVLACVGNVLGFLAYFLAKLRRHVVTVNLALCFPECSQLERKKLARACFKMVMRSFLERSLCWWASEKRLRHLVKIKGLENLQALQGQAVILLVPHFVALDIVGTRIAMDVDVASVYSNQLNPWLNKLLYHGRTRFGKQKIFSRQQGMRPIVQSLREGRPLYYLPDLDYGPKHSIFVPFFGVPTATIPTLSRLSKLSNAQVLPCIARMLPYARGYELEIGAPWSHFPTEDVIADTMRMNQFIEAQVRTMPEQYYWVHKRFKTRPPGDPKFY